MGRCKEMWSKAPRSRELCVRWKQWWALLSCRISCTNECMGYRMRKNQECVLQPSFRVWGLRLLWCNAVVLLGLDRLLLQMKAQRSFETSEANHDPKQRRIPEDMNSILFSYWRPTALFYVNRTGICRISKSHIWQPYVLVIAGTLSLFWCP
jgi:hypothetical protein